MLTLKASLGYGKFKVPEGEFDSYINRSKQSNHCVDSIDLSLNQYCLPQGTKIPVNLISIIMSFVTLSESFSKNKERQNSIPFRLKIERFD